jgi:ribosomal protein L16/L10AE
MVRHATHNDRLATKLVQNAAQLVVQFFPEQLVTRKRAAVFRGKDHMNQNFGEGLGHGVSMNDMPV